MTSGQTMVTLPLEALQALTEQNKSDEDHRCIVLSGEVEEPMVQYAIERVTAMAARSSDPMTVVLNSPGGSVSDGWALYDLFSTCYAPVITVGLGAVSSAATLAFLGGRYRLLGPNARMMVHATYLGGLGAIDAADLTALAKNMRASQKKLDRLYARATGLPLEEIREWAKKDTYFSARQAVKLGLADKVLSTRPRLRQG
jgi:ATP-dependent Clp protease protease subunit